MIDNQIFPSLVSFSKLEINNFTEVQNVLIVHASSSEKNGGLEKAKLLLKNKNISFLNTSTVVTEAGVLPEKLACLDQYFDLIIGIGGGTQIDLTKLILAKYVDNNLNNFFTKKNFNPFLKKPKLMFWVTLPGSGAEASKSATINTPDGKLIYTSQNFLPSFIFYDIETIFSAKLSTLILGLVDTIIHALESNKTILKNSFTSPLSEFVIRNGVQLIEKYCNSTLSLDKETIKQFCISSIYGGLAQCENGTGLGHALAHTLENFYKLPHSESILLCSYISLTYRIELSKSKEDKIIKEVLDDLYLKLFSKANIKKHSSFLLILDETDFISRSKKDPCWKLEKERIRVDVLFKIIKRAKEKQKWNI